MTGCRTCEAPLRCLDATFVLPESLDERVRHFEYDTSILSELDQLPLCSELTDEQITKYRPSCEYRHSAPLFFISFFFASSYLLLNIIIAVVLDNFVENASNEGLLQVDSMFDSVRRKLLMDKFVLRMRQKVKVYQQMKAVFGDKFKFREEWEETRELRISADQSAQGKLDIMAKALEEKGDLPRLDLNGDAISERHQKLMQKSIIRFRCLIGKRASPT
eukprot:gene7378-8789_t